MRNSEWTWHNDALIRRIGNDTVPHEYKPQAIDGFLRAGQGNPQVTISCFSLQRCSSLSPDRNLYF